MRKKLSRLSFTFATAFLLLIIVIYLKGMDTVNTTLPQTTVYVDPQTNWGDVGQNFTVNISISSVIDLYGWEFKMNWNTAILDTAEVLEGSFLKSGGITFFLHKINNTLGYVIVDCTLLGNVAGVSGSGTLAIIKFHVKTIGECPLDLYDTILVNSSEQTIEHTTVDGYYYTSIHDIAVVDLKASSTEVNVTVENQGTQAETFNVNAYYTRRYDPLIGTQNITLAKGAIVTLTFVWTPPFVGQYKIRAETSIVPGETDFFDNSRTILIHIGYRTHDTGKQTANSLSLNDFHVGASLFLIALAMIVARVTQKTQNYMVSSNPKREYFSHEEYLATKQPCNG